MLVGKTLKEISALVDTQVITVAEALAHAEAVATRNAGTVKGNRWAAFARKLKADGIADHKAAFAATKPQAKPKKPKTKAESDANIQEIRDLFALLLKKIG